MGRGSHQEGLRMQPSWFLACLAAMRVWRRADDLNEIVDTTALRPACGALSLERSRRDIGQ